MQVGSLLEHLKKLNNDTKQLQLSNLSLQSERRIFDNLVSKFSAFKLERRSYLTGDIWEKVF